MANPEINIVDDDYFNGEIKNEYLPLGDPEASVRYWITQLFFPFPNDFYEQIIKVIYEHIKYNLHNPNKFIPHTYTLPTLLHRWETTYQDHRFLVKEEPNFWCIYEELLKKIKINTDDVKTIYSPLRVMDLRPLHVNSSCTTVPQNIWDKINQIITWGDLPSKSYPKGISTWEEDNNKYLCWMSFMKTRVPIFLVASKDMPDKYSSISHPISQPCPKQEDNQRDKENDDKIQADTIEYLGCYFPEKDVLGNKMPVIYLCPERIKAEADKYKNRKALFYIYAIVLIHEFAHAIMDETNHIDKYESKSFPSYSFNEKSRRYLEESLANMITLKYMKIASQVKHNQQYFRFTQDFISNQADGYKWGNIMYEAKVDWTKWRNCKKDAEKNQDAINNWINEVAKPNPIAEEIKGLYNAIFV